jgi:hypothetical protein
MASGGQGQLDEPRGRIQTWEVLSACQSHSFTSLLCHTVEGNRRGTWGVMLLRVRRPAICDMVTRPRVGSLKCAGVCQARGVRKTNHVYHDRTREFRWTARSRARGVLPCRPDAAQSTEACSKQKGTGTEVHEYYHEDRGP